MSGNGYSIRQVKSKEDRKRPSVFLRLKTDEAFKAVALFEPDPGLEGNLGYFEYYDHYDKQANQYVPCSGEKCPFCAANDNPSTRAVTAWYFPQAADVKDRLKIFTMNYSTIQEISDEAEDEDGIRGRTVRIKRLSDKGDYRVKVSAQDKPLGKVELKTAMADLEERFPQGLRALVMTQLEAQMKRLKAMEALDDDGEDEDEEESQVSKKGKPKVEVIEAIVFIILAVSRKNRTVTVEHEGEEITLVAPDDDDEIDVGDFKKGDEVTASAILDEDEGWVLTALESVVQESDEAEEESEEPEDEAEEEQDEAEESEESEEESEDEAEDEAEDDEEEEDEEGKPSATSSEVTAQAYEIVKIQQNDEIFDFRDADDNRLKMWLGDGVEVDYDEIKRGMTVVVDAVKDEEDDWIITGIELADKPKASSVKKKK